ncbi:uncharacterized protein [Leptinotarsa decemlineata]|uniref:uncharacterized protein n=1 Tax=Leptinotarsa decemlineata TaxID=7539 RepID=UPI003D30AF8F
MDRYLLALSLRIKDQTDLENNPGDRGDDTFHKKKYKRTYKYNFKWNDEFSEWLTNRESKPYCKSCNLILEGSESHIVRYSKTRKLIAKMCFLKRSQNIQVVMENLPSTELATSVQKNKFQSSLPLEAPTHTKGAVVPFL